MPSKIETVIGAENALISATTLREFLQIPEADMGQDDFLADLAESAASAVAQDIQIPIVPVMGAVPVVPSDAQAAIRIADRYALTALAVRHVAAGAPAGAAATDNVSWPDESEGVIPQTSPLTGDGIPLIGGAIVITPPRAGWPSTSLSVVYERGLLVNSANLKAIRALVLLTTARLWEGAPAIPSIERSVYHRLAAPIRDSAEKPTGYVPL